jgi:L-iditol 2-dehydrogenase
VIVACSSDIAQEEAMELAAPRARVLFFGGLPKGTTAIRFPSNILHYKEVQVHGSYASRHRDQVHALDMLARDVGGIRRVIGAIVPLEEAPDAFPEIRAGGVLKVVVAP